MISSQPPSPSPAGRPDEDNRPSIEVGVAASMLRRGHQPLDVANATGVPLALVELIATEHHPDPPEHSEPALPAGAISSTPEELRSAVRPNLPVSRTQPGASRWAAWICCAAALVVLGNVGLAAAAEITHMSTLAMIAVILTPLLLTALGLCAIGCACAGRGRSPRRR